MLFRSQMLSMLVLKNITRSRMQPHRCLNLQEYQSKQLLVDHGCAVQKFVVVDGSNAADDALKKFDQDEYVVKAQILAGGRGKGRFADGQNALSGVFITKKKVQASDAAKQMLGRRLITKQTNADGVRVDRVMVAESVTIVREAYLAIVMDREHNGPVIVSSSAGGVDIEEVAEKTPHLLLTEPIDIIDGLSDEKARKIASTLNFDKSLEKSAADQIRRLYDLFLKIDATQIEINPFVETADKRVICVDAKFNMDPNAEFRQSAIFAMDDQAEMDPREADAHRCHLNYIGLDGNIACLVNGAGLAMATMDIIKLYGGAPANFLDVGGSVTEDQVYEAFRIITNDKQVKALLVNIFGGIVNCAVIANGLIKAFQRIKLQIPLIVRLEGTNVDAARQLLNKSGLPIVTAADLGDAARKAVDAI